MRLVPADTTAPALLAFVSDDELHAGRLADDASQRRNAALRHIRDQSSHPDAANLFVIGQREMERALQSAPHDFRDERETSGREALHVGDAATVDPSADPARGEWIRVPGLAVYGDDVGVARQHDPALPSVTVLRRKRTEQI